jgi:hypothetical protein
MKRNGNSRNIGLSGWNSLNSPFTDPLKKWFMIWKGCTVKRKDR